MGYRKFGKDRHRPPGEWVQTTELESVVGIQYRKAAAQAFANAVEQAERSGLSYGLQLELQPNHPQDANAIAVYGVAECKRWLRGPLRREWLVGYLVREMAAEVHEELISKSVSIAAELYEIYEGDGGFIDIKYFVLAPPGHSASVRRRARTARSS